VASSDPSIEDVALVERAKAGDQSALAALYRRHERLVYNLALRMTGDPWEAADLTQDAFLKAFRGLDGFRSDARFTTWLHRIVVNVVYDHLRRRRSAPVDDEQMSRLAAHPEDRMAAATGAPPGSSDGLSEPVRAALLSLDEGFRMAVVLCDLLGHSYAEAAAMLGVREGTVKSRVFRGRAALAERLRAEGYGPAAGNQDRDPDVTTRPTTITTPEPS